MKFQSLAASAVLSLFAAKGATSFGIVSPSTSTSNKKTSTTQLHISSWGARGPPSRWKEEEVDPGQKIQAYLKAPEPIAARPNLDGTILVSGWVNNKERTDQTIFNFLNDEESAFKFEKIVAFVDDTKFSKKRLISRSARYSGLLDKLDFVQAETPGALPTADQLKEASAKSWVVNAGSSLDTVKAVAALAKEASVQNVALLMTGAQQLEDAQAIADAVSSFDASDDSAMKFTIVAVGAITETPEGMMPYAIQSLGDADAVLPANATYSRDESLRITAECLGLASSCNKAMVFTEVSDVNATEYKLIRGLREGGYTRPQEIDHMISKGPEAYAKAVEDFKTRSPAKTSYDGWLEEKQKELDESAADRKERVKKDYEEKKQTEIEDIAREWAKREYFRKATSGDMPYSEEEYIQSVWERALFEGDLKYRMLHGQETDERKELAEFKKKQEKKKATMLARAKADLDELLDEDDDDKDE
mmetsp:Transcript_18152/g.26495  ORF Transcript_18152/g.26495 Transcript_18152/m.26495 type:complete len:476 (+) Transcript_18152:60-1487(+)|eukprot:CAMPEP_0197259838 /NCGR_PEP_ID=MMETSP1429-20130617/83718_1 /TAXON_ID=49237 /ORGANISM="Chaetoceros  sp., Strain UNC1202" /LENGTH=475 /DNA_ID=CAMNT_0042724057 /DNA_START=61 /DNA_END=1488 /DNA_ORIENTATION=+